MLIEPDTIVAQAIEFLPGFEMLGISARRHLRLEKFLRQRVGQLVAHFQMLELLPISQEVKYKNFHVIRPRVDPNQGSAIQARLRRCNPRLLSGQPHFSSAYAGNLSVGLLCEIVPCSMAQLA